MTLPVLLMNLDVSDAVAAISAAAISVAVVSVAGTEFVLLPNRTTAI